MFPESLSTFFSASQRACACITLLTAIATRVPENTTGVNLDCIPYCLNLSQGNALMYSRQIHQECKKNVLSVQECKTLYVPASVLQWLL